jgi:hypothetical protein
MKYCNKCKACEEEEEEEEEEKDNSFFLNNIFLGL